MKFSGRTVFNSAGRAYVGKGEQKSPPQHFPFGDDRMLLTRLQLVALCGFAFAMPLVMGCSGAKHPPTYPVQGELFVKGQPADGARLILQPVVAGDLQSWPLGFPMATVQPDGKFQFSCFGENDGAPEGTYKLIARWDEGDGSAEENTDAPPPKNRLDNMYFDPARSPWSVKVEPQPNQLTRFEVP